jgi:hypothetical protein
MAETAQDVVAHHNLFSHEQTHPRTEYPFTSTCMVVACLQLYQPVRLRPACNCTNQYGCGLLAIVPTSTVAACLQFVPTSTVVASWQLYQQKKGLLAIAAQMLQQTQVRECNRVKRVVYRPKYFRGGQGRGKRRGKLNSSY